MSRSPVSPPCTTAGRRLPTSGRAAPALAVAPPDPRGCGLTTSRVEKQPPTAAAFLSSASVSPSVFDQSRRDCLIRTAGATIYRVLRHQGYTCYQVARRPTRGHRRGSQACEPMAGCALASFLSPVRARGPVPPARWGSADLLEQGTRTDVVGLWRDRGARSCAATCQVTHSVQRALSRSALRHGGCSDEKPGPT